MTEDTKHKVDLTTTILRWGLGVLGTLIIGYLVGISSRVDKVNTSVSAVDVRVESIELWRAERKANEWNLGMQLVHEREVEDKFAEIKKDAAISQKVIIGQLTAIQIAIAKLPEEIPGGEWVGYVKERMDNTDERVDKLEDAK